MSDLDQQRYPVGRFERCTGSLSAPTRAGLIGDIEEAPSIIRGLVERLTDAELEARYRDGGWTIRQVVHHVPDSHMNAYVRMKLAVTEDAPAIKTYDEARWAELPDGRTAPIASSLDLLDALHRRWVRFLRALTEDDFLRTYGHPELGRVPLYEALAIYAWHGRHHAGHIRNARENGSRRV
jgi:uncharacterized damage-inducible protein DinB